MDNNDSGYILLEPSVIPAGQAEEGVNLMSYLQGAYVTLFVVIIASAILSLVYFGFTYMISDVSTSKAGAKEKLKKIILGLIIALTTVLILNLINPDLLEFNLF